MNRFHSPRLCLFCFFLINGSFFLQFFSLDFQVIVVYGPWKCKKKNLKMFSFEFSRKKKERFKDQRFVPGVSKRREGLHFLFLLRSFFCCRRSIFQIKRQREILARTSSGSRPFGPKNKKKEKKKKVALGFAFQRREEEEAKKKIGWEKKIWKEKEKQKQKTTPRSAGFRRIFLRFPAVFLFFFFF